MKEISEISEKQAEKKTKEELAKVTEENLKIAV